MERQDLPVGFRFHPTDEEVVDYFLTTRNLRLEFLLTEVPDINDTKLDPWDLTKNFKGELRYQGNDKDWWFFSSRTRYQDTPRQTNSGRWINNSGYNVIMGAEDDQKMEGIRIDFTFHRRQGQGQYERFVNWKLYEYRLKDDRLDRLLPPDEKTFFALCHLSYKEEKAKKKTGVIPQTNGEIVILPQRRQRRRLTESVGAPLQHSNQGIVSTNSEQQRYLQDSILSSHQQQSSNTFNVVESAPFSYDDQWPTEMFLHNRRQGMLLGETPSSSQHSTYLYGNQRAQSAQSLSGIVPAEEKKTSIENRNARPQLTLRSAPNPRWKEPEEYIGLIEETKRKLRLRSGPKLTGLNQNSLSCRIKYLVNAAVGLVMTIMICSQMVYAGIILLFLCGCYLYCF